MQKITQSPIFVLLLVGVPFLLFGLLFGLLIRPALERQTERIAPLPPQSATALADTPAGREVLVEGRISRQNPSQFRDFVAFKAEECHAGIDDEIECDLIQEVTPPLLLDLPDGPVAIANDDYQLQGSSSFASEGTLDYSGIVIGDAVLAVGTALVRDGRPRLEAEFITVGSKASYLEQNARSARFWQWFGFLFAGIGLLLLGIAAFMGLNARR